MKKRLTAWLLVFCMALSLLPGTAFAAENTGSGDGTTSGSGSSGDGSAGSGTDSSTSDDSTSSGVGSAIITYDLNDGSPYTLQLHTNPGVKPDNQPGAIRKGMPFKGWSPNPDGGEVPQYNDGEILYAQWTSGYTVTFDFGTAKGELPTTPAPNLTTKTNDASKLDEAYITYIEGLVKDIEDKDGVNLAFDGWYDEDGKKVDLHDTINKDGTTLTAHWIDVYTITFTYGNGDQAVKLKTGAGGKLLHPEQLIDPPKFDGNTFGGWYIVLSGTTDPGKKDAVEIPKGSLSPNGSGVWGFLISDPKNASYANYVDTKTKTLELKANWTAEYRITLDANRGNFGSDTQLTKEVWTDNKGTLTLPEEKDWPQRTGFKFRGWSTDKGYTYVAGTKTTTDKEPGKSGFFIDEETGSFSFFTKSTTLYAVWEKTLTITIFYGNGKPAVNIYPALESDSKYGTGPYVIYDIVTKYLDPKVVGGIDGIYTLQDNWHIKHDTDEKDIPANDLVQYKFTKDATITAIWRPGYEITFNANGGTIGTGTDSIKPIQTGTDGHIKIGDAPKFDESSTTTDDLTLKAPNGYHGFLGWYTRPEGGEKIESEGTPGINGSDDDRFYDFTSFKGKTTVYAHWGPPYDIEYVTNQPNCTVTTVTEQTKTDDKGTIPANLPSTFTGAPDSKDFVFEGWHFRQDCTDDPIGATAPVYTGKDVPIKLYARWVKPRSTYEIVYNTPAPATGLNDGQIKYSTIISEDDQKKTTSSGTYPGILPTVTCDVPYIFDKWVTKDGKAVYAGANVDDKQAVGTQIFLTATYKTMGGNSSSGISLQTVPQSAPVASIPFSLRPPATSPLLAAELAGDEGVYDIVFNPTNGTVDPATAETKDGKIDLEKLPVPTRTGYYFVGWYTQPTGGRTPVSLNTVFDDVYVGTDGKITLYAVWEPYVRFYPNGGSFPADRPYQEVHTVNHKLALDQWPNPPEAPEGKTFAGWFTVQTGGTKVEPNKDYLFDDTNNHSSAPINLYAQWEETTYTVTFDLNYTGAGTNPTAQVAKSVTGDEVATEYPINSVEIRKGYTFLGWFTSQDESGRQITTAQPYPISADTTVYAHWRENRFKVTFKDGSTTLKEVTTVEGRVPQSQFPTVPFREGQEFTGWTCASITGPVTSNTYFTGDSEVAANWKTITEEVPEGSTRVTFYVNVPPLPTDMAGQPGQDGVAHFTMITDKNNQKLKQLPVRVSSISSISGDGWREENGSTKVTKDQSYSRDTNLYIYVAKKFQITFNWNNGDDTKPSNTFVRDTDDRGRVPSAQWPDSETIEKMNPGSKFDGWYLADGTPVSTQTEFTDSTTIYAHWKSPYTITFDANGGIFQDGSKTQSVKTDTGGVLDPFTVPPDPSWEGHATFCGWATEKGASPEDKIDPSTNQQPYEGPTTLYAIWGPPYKITYVEGENATMPELKPGQDMTKDDGTYPELPVPTHPRDSFKGWYESEDFSGSPVAAGGQCGTKGPVTLYAKWDREPPYTITFDANLNTGDMETSATIVDPVTGKAVLTLPLKTDDKGVLLQAPPEPTIRGGKFQGWYTKAEEGTGELISDIATHTFEDDTTLYAHWDTMEFTITFDFNLSSIGKDFNITTYTTTKGKSLSFLPGELPQAASETKKIEGWYTVPNPVAGKDQPVTTSNTFERDTTLYAKWVDAPDLPIVFKYPNVTFLDAENGDAMVTLEVDKDYKMASVPPGPYKEGLTFSGWFYREPDRPDGEEKQFTKDTEVTGSLRVYPKYVGSGYTVTFEPGEESELDPIKVKTTSEGRIPDGSMPSPTWEGHTFAGWYTSVEGGTKITRRTVFTQDTTVYAHWDSSSGPDDPNDPDNPDRPTGPTSPPFTITFNPNGGNLNANTTALTDLNGRLMSLPTPARTGYHFDGWYNGNERVTTATVFSANTTITAQWSTGSGGGSGDSGSGELNGYAITVANTSGGRVSVSTTYAREGDRVTVTVRPYSGYQLDRVDVVNARGYDVELRDQGSNRYVFYMPASRVTVDAVFMELIANGGNGGNTGNTGGSTGGNTSWNPGGSTGGNTSWNPGGTTSGGASSGLGIFSQPVLNTVPMPYLDVHASDWYYSSVDYMWQRQLMGGVSSNRFGPQATTSNAMVWTILARLAGVDVTSGASVWYENARSWAVSNRISDGVGPNSAVTREQLATMLWNFKGSPAASYDLGQFGDRGQISTYQAECALGWAVANGIVSGTGNRLNPRGTATRAEVAAMITRFCQNT